jgi:hypothetical protein
MSPGQLSLKMVTQLHTLSSQKKQVELMPLKPHNHQPLSQKLDSCPTSSTSSKLRLKLDQSSELTPLRNLNGQDLTLLQVCPSQPRP